MMSIFKEREIADFAFSDEWRGNTMLFIAGPRQCGKTSLARKFLEEKGCSPLYYNWDIEKVRTRYRKDPDFFVKEASWLRIEKPYVVLDEIHKITRWKNMAKTFDVKLAESPSVSKDLAESYYRFGPFPAPLISGSEKRSRKWHRDYITLLVREDLRDLSGIRELDRVSHLVELLPGRVGSLLSLRSLGEDLGAKLADAKFSPQLRRFRDAVDGQFPILQVVSQPGIFLKKEPGEYLVGYDRLLMAL